MSCSIRQDNIRRRDHLLGRVGQDIAPLQRDIGRGHVDVNHLRGEIWQIEIDGKRVIYRLLFAEQGRFSQVLLALEIVTKKWQSAKSRHIQLAERRLSDWRTRGRSRTKLVLPERGPAS
jgi:phage-related protein